jgi:phosphatidate cytidylyltransferase
MSPGLQFQEPLYRTYALIWLGLLVTGGILLGLLRATRGPQSPTLAGALVTYRSWWRILPLVAIPLGLGRVATILAVTLLSLWTFREFGRATGLARDWGFTGAVYAAILIQAIWSLIPWYGMFLVWPIYVTAFLLVIPVLRGRPEGMLQNSCLSLLGYVYFGWFLGHLGYLANVRNGLGYLLFLTLAVSLNDIAAFTVGKLLGRTPLAPAVSPRKTWEGSIGAVVVTAVVVFALRFTFPHFGPLQLLLSTLIVGIGGQLGDLVISGIKRDLGVKDLGAVFPGHGGWLDRFDSLIFAAPLFFHMNAYFFQVP